MKLSGCRLLLQTLVMVCLSPALAQSLQLTFSAAAEPSLALALLDQRTEAGRASLAVQFLPRPGLALHLRHTTGLGPLGNVIIDADAAGLTAGPAAAALSARAAVGPLALRLRGFVHSADDLLLLRPRDQAFPLLPVSRGHTVWGFQLGADWRLSRDLLLSADPGLILGGRGAALSLPLQLQLRGLPAPHDLRLLVETMLPLMDARQELRAWSAAGAGLRVNRQRAAAWELWLLYGGNGQLQAPGLRFAVQDSLADGTVQAAVRLEPYRSDLAGLSVELGYSATVNDLDLDLLLRLQAPELTLSLTTAFRLPLD